MVQQTPSSQKPLEQSPGAAHFTPRGRGRDADRAVGAPVRAAAAVQRDRSGAATLIERARSAPDAIEAIAASAAARTVPSIRSIRQPP